MLVEVKFTPVQSGGRRNGEKQAPKSEKEKDPGEWQLKDIWREKGNRVTHKEGENVGKRKGKQPQ